MDQRQPHPAGQYSGSDAWNTVRLHRGRDARVVTPVSVRVAEVTAEDDHGELDIPWHLAPQTGSVALQLRTTIRRVGMGAGLARRAELVAAVAALPDSPGVLTSVSGGTFTLGGPGWLGLAGIGTLPPDAAMPLDWMVQALLAWFTTAFSPLGIAPTVGRVDGAWCPGFSDIAVDGKKLIGLGFRMTRGLVAMRGMMAVTPISAADHDLLAATHALIGVTIRPECATSIAEASGRPGLTVTSMIDHLSGFSVPPD